MRLRTTPWRPGLPVIVRETLQEVRPEEGEAPRALALAQERLALRLRSKNGWSVTGSASAACIPPVQRPDHTPTKLVSRLQTRRCISATCIVADRPREPCLAYADRWDWDGVELCIPPCCTATRTPGCPTRAGPAVVFRPAPQHKFQCSQTALVLAVECAGVQLRLNDRAQSDIQAC